MTDCEVCRHGSRHNCPNVNGNPIPKDWGPWNESMGKKVDSKKFWTYFVCKKNTFSISSPCNKFEPKGSK